MQRVIVTGAAKGIGRAIVRSLLAHSYAVLAVDIDQVALDELSRESGSGLEALRCDVTDSSAVQALFERLGNAPPYGLVNNAGIYLGKRLDAYAPEEIDQVLRVNLFAAVLMSKHFGRLVAGPALPGAIVNIGSSSMYGGSDPAYSATKAGLVGLTKATAKTFAPSVRVNLVAPGIVETGMFSSLPQEVVASYRAGELIKRPLQPDDVAGTVLFLLSEAARNYTGAVFDLNNGFHL
jgi:3-oxoacyl-[acyl-carrier protein] reductase